MYFRDFYELHISTDYFTASTGCILRLDDSYSDFILVEDTLYFFITILLYIVCIVTNIVHLLLLYKSVFIYSELRRFTILERGLQ